MSGHSKWNNIKNRKGAQDKKRSEIFTKLARNIMTALRSGRGLDVAINRAKAVNMPKENIDRLLKRFEEKKNSLVDMVMEGFTHGGVPIIVVIETDNKNRSLAEIREIFKLNESSVGETNSVAFLFDRDGMVEIDKLNEEMQLELIDDGAVDFEGDKVYCKVEDLSRLIEKVNSLGWEILDSGIEYRSKSPLEVNDEIKNKIGDFLAELRDNEDVVNVFLGCKDVEKN